MSWMASATRPTLALSVAVPVMVRAPTGSDAPLAGDEIVVGALVSIGLDVTVKGTCTGDPSTLPAASIAVTRIWYEPAAFGSQL